MRLGLDSYRESVKLWLALYGYGKLVQILLPNKKLSKREFWLFFSITGFFG